MTNLTIAMSSFSGKTWYRIWKKWHKTEKKSSFGQVFKKLDKNLTNKKTWQRHKKRPYRSFFSRRPVTYIFYPSLFSQSPITIYVRNRFYLIITTVSDLINISYSSFHNKAIYICQKVHNRDILKIEDAQESSQYWGSIT